MTPAEQAIPEAQAPFSVRRRERGGRTVAQFSASLSGINALKARIRAQSKVVAEHIQKDPEAQAFIDDWATPEPINR